MKQPQISVVIPAFNRAAVLPRTIGSVLGQTLRDFEVIVVDDASGDAPEKVVKSIGDARVRVLRLAQNSGAGAARNAGVRAATGEWVAFLDSDDWWEPAKLERQLAALRRAPDPANSFASHAYMNEDGDAPRPWPKRGPRPGEDLGDYTWCHNGSLQTSTWMIPRAICQRFPFDESLRRHQDWDLMLRLQRAGLQLIYLDEVLGHFWCRKSPERLSDVVDATYSERFLQTKGELFTKAARAAFEARVLGWQYHASGRRWKALGKTLRAMALGAIPPLAAAKIVIQLNVPAIHRWLARRAAAAAARG